MEGDDGCAEYKKTGEEKKDRNTYTARFLTRSIQDGISNKPWKKLEVTFDGLCSVDEQLDTLLNDEQLEAPLENSGLRSSSSMATGSCGGLSGGGEKIHCCVSRLHSYTHLRTFGECSAALMARQRLSRD